jgi:uncharacterized protein (TIGR03086 family)
MTTMRKTSVVNLVEIHQRVGVATRRLVAGIPAGRWSASSNCDMPVRALVNHIVTGHWWAAELAAGKTIGEVGARLDGDVLGPDPLAEYDRAHAQATAIFSRPGVLEQTCRLSYGDVLVAEYCSHRILDTFIHGWDIARATDQDDTLDGDLVDIAYAMFEPHAAELQATGAFGTPVPVPANADTQTKLLAMLGRDNRR